MQKGKQSRKLRVARPKRMPRKSWLEEAKQLQEQILARRGGELLPDICEEIREIREGRAR